MKKREVLIAFVVVASYLALRGPDLLGPFILPFETGFQESIALYEELYDSEKILSVYPGISRVYLNLDDLNNALYYSQLAFNEGNTWSTAEILSEIYAEKGDYQKAYEYFYIFKHISDSSDENSLSREITELENQYIFKQEKKSSKLRRSSRRS